MSVTPPESPALPPVAALRDALARCLTRDRHRLGQRLRELDRLRDAAQRAPKHAALADAVARSQAAVAARAARLPVLTYPDLPVAARASDIIAAIRDHQVVVIAGETGSGKTTQLPKLALAAGRGVHGLIGHTQPRRIAARAVATRIAEEIGSPVGELVGFKVRFTDESSPDGFIKLMTDGVLLAELAQDRYLSAYDTLIIDEAHERSLNIDFLLGVLKQILPKRPDLKVIITSATIDVERFSRHFRDAQGRDAPVISVEGRTYPVEVLYRPIAEAGAASDEDEGFDAIEEAIPRAVLAAVEECLQLERQKGRAGQGDILVFSSHEREIREIADLLRKYGPPHTEILPLYARLSVSEQQKVFQKGRGRRIVIATNVAETSLTVPNIHYVIDPGFARISRYSWRSKVQRLPIEAVAQASANQRKGRCGRVAPGVCIRLYSEADFLGRTEFTEPEIRRTNLAAVILQMAALRLGEIDRFPFLDAPDSRLISDGLRLLEELGAVDGEAQLTDIGRTLSRFPVDPRIARMLLEARSRGALREVLIIAAALGSQDPRDRPHDRQQAADERHAQFRHPESDFLWYVKLWDTLEAQRGELSENQRREFARRHFLSWLRLREWRETHRQLLQLCRDIGWDVSTKAGEAEAPVRASQEKGKSASVSRTAPPPGTLAAGAEREKGMTASNAGSEPAPDSLNYEAVHRSLLAGLLSRIAQKQEDREYLAARGQKAFVFPGSVLAKKGPPWIMAAELVETARVYARTVARIEPEWAEAIAGDLLKRRHFEPHWEKRQGRVMAYEQVTLYGLILVAKRKLAYEGINPALAREIFIRSALVEGDADLRAPFFTHNRALIEDVRVLEDKARRRDILVDEEALFAFYAERIPAEVTGLKAFEGWRRDIERQDPKHLFLTRDYLLARADADTAAADDDFPDHIELNGTRFALEYRFEPGHPADGVSLLVPVGLLDEVDEARLGWLVPGLLGEKVEALLKGLPKPLRRLLVPVPDTARALLAEIGDGQGSLLARLSEVLCRRGLTVGPADWGEAGLPAHCRFHIKVLGEKQQLLAEGRDLTALRRQCREQGGAALPQAAGRLEQTGLTDWPAEDIPESVALTVKGMQSRAYPALVEAGSTVDLRLFPTRREAEAAHARGLNALYRLRLAAEFRQAGRRVAGHKALLLHYAPHGRAEALEAMFVTALSDSVFVAGRPLVYTRVAFEQCLSQFRPGLLAEAERLLALVVQVYEGLAAVQRQLEAFRAPVFARAVADIRGQLAALGPADFLARVPVARWQHYPRYLKALALRLDKLPNNVVRDDAASAELAQRWQALQARQAALAARDIVAPALEDYRWLLEEYRVALFAQTVKTAVPVSATRLDKLWQALPA